MGTDPLDTLFFYKTMVKKYKSKMRSMGLLVELRGEIISVIFNWDFIYPNSPMRGCSFSTDDPELQKALESHEYFNRKLQPSFWTDDVEEKKETPKATPTKEEAMEKKGRKLIKE